MGKAQAVKQNRVQRNGRFEKQGRSKPLRYFVDGRLPPDVDVAQKRLAAIKEEHKRAANLVNNATDINTERQNSRKKFLAHTEKEILLLTKWIEDNETYGATGTPMTAREKILDTMDFLTGLQKNGSLLTAELMILDVLADYKAQQ